MKLFAFKGVFDTNNSFIYDCFIDTKTLKYSHFIQTEMNIYKQPLNYPPPPPDDLSMLNTFYTLFKDKHASRIPFQIYAGT